MARSQMSAPEIDDVMHSSDQFDDLGFRLVDLAEGSAPEAVPAVPLAGILAVAIVIAAVSGITLVPRRGASASS